MELIKARWLMPNRRGEDIITACVEDTARVRSKIIDNGFVKQIKCLRQRNGQ